MVLKKYIPGCPCPEEPPIKYDLSLAQYDNPPKWKGRFVRPCCDKFGCCQCPKQCCHQCLKQKKLYRQPWHTCVYRKDLKPETDYSILCCDDYVDLSINHDFVKLDRNLDLRKPPRRAALENFLFLKNAGAVNAEFNWEISKCAPYTCWIKYEADSTQDSIASMIEKSMRLRFEPPLTRWYELKRRPEPRNYACGMTNSKSLIRPFHKDVSFSTPIDERTQFPTGNRSPFKELRDLKRNM